MMRQIDDVKQNVSSAGKVAAKWRNNYLPQFGFDAGRYYNLL